MPIFKVPANVDNKTYLENQNKIHQICLSNINKNKTKKHIFEDALKGINGFISDFKTAIKPFFLNNKKDVLYVAFIPNAGIGDIMRQKTILEELQKLAANFNSNIVIDIYAESVNHLFKNIKQVRFFIKWKAIYITKNHYDIVYRGMVYHQYIYGAQILRLRKGKMLSDLIADNLRRYKLKYPFCFDDFYDLFQFEKKALANSLHLIDVYKITAGIGNIGDNSLSIKYDETPLEKFGINAETAYITIQSGLSNARYYGIDKWRQVIKSVKSEFGAKLKIVQIGVGENISEDIDINIIGKTSFDDLCSILKKSLLHLDCDCGCMHIAKALKTKCLIIWGTSNADYISYDENINITSSICGGCYCIARYEYKCVLGYEKALCMSQIEPEFVAQKAIEYLDSKCCI